MLFAFCVFLCLNPHQLLAAEGGAEKSEGVTTQYTLWPPADEQTTTINPAKSDPPPQADDRKTVINPAKEDPLPQAYDRMRAIDLVTEERHARLMLSDWVRELFDAEDFDKLESIAKDLRDNDSRFPSGVHKLVFFYDGFGEGTDSEEGFARNFSLMKKWAAKYPNSVTRRVAESALWIGYGYFVRGEGYADTVPEYAWPLLRQRLQNAYELIKTAPALKADDDPERYNKQLLIGRMQGWDRDRYNKVFKEACEQYPGYYLFYLEKANYLMPRWGGQPGEWQKFADDSIELAPKGDGHIYYFRIMYTTYFAGEWHNFKYPGISWNKMKKGLQDMANKYPNSERNLNFFAYFAIIAKDRETAVPLIEMIGDNPSMDVWKSRIYYDECRNSLKTGDQLPMLVRE